MKKSLFQHILKCAGLGLTFYILDLCGVFTHFFELDFELHFYYPNENEKFLQYQQFSGKVNSVENAIFIRDIPRKCDGVSTFPKITFLIKSAIQNKNRRASIRRTWGFENRFSDVAIKRVFIVGTSPSSEDMDSVHLEAIANGDIIQADFYDTYFNNTLKTLIAMRWALEHCRNSTYFMFVDDDYYVSTKNLLRFISQPVCYSGMIDGAVQNIASKDRLFVGFVFQTAPHRHKFSKWYVALKEYPFDKWPPYVTAGAFVLSRSALYDLYHTSMRLRLFRFDDVFMGIAAMKAKLVLTHCDMFCFYKPEYKVPENYKHVIASHGFENSEEMENVWNECRSAGFA